MIFDAVVTLENEVAFTGVGIHSGKSVSINLVPKETPGIVFIRTDLKQAEIPVNPSTLKQANRATWLKKGRASIATPEHLLAALAGMGINALSIEIDSEEVPNLDGSSTVFVEKLRGGKRKALKHSLSPIVIKDTLQVKIENRILKIEPHETLIIDYKLEYPDSFFKVQEARFDPENQSFDVDVAPARTFGFLSEIESLRKLGLARGGTYDNALVITKTNFSSSLRLQNELAMHKILDIIGDLSILGRPIRGHITGERSGHELNAKLVKKIAKLYL